jgi:hypothetical protein
MGTFQLTDALVMVNPQMLEYHTEDVGREIAAARARHYVTAEKPYFAITGTEDEQSEILIPGVELIIDETITTGTQNLGWQQIELARRLRERGIQSVEMGGAMVGAVESVGEYLQKQGIDYVVNRFLTNEAGIALTELAARNKR